MTIEPIRTFLATAQRLWRDRRGTTLVLVAGSLTALIGFTGLAVETGLWYTIKRQNQSAADVAALSGAFELAGGLTNGLTATQAYPDICALAQRDAGRNNFAFANGFACPKTSPGLTNPPSGQMYANNPPVLGANAGNANAVEVILAQQQNTTFASLFLPNVTIDTRAVATVTNNSVCLLALGASPSKFKGCKAGFGICGVGNAGINAPDCSVVSDATTDNAINLVGSASITAGSVSTAGNISLTGNASTAPPAKTFQQVIPDPYANTLTHAALTAGMPAAACAPPTKSIVQGVTWYVYPTNCMVQTSAFNGQNNIVLGGDNQIAVNTKAKGNPEWDVSGTVLLNAGSAGNAGTYWITDGDLNVSGTLGCTFSAATPPGTSCSVASGAGVTIILTTAQAKNGVIGTVEMPPGNTSTSLNAPTASTTATFAGDLIIQDTNGIPAGTTYTNTSTDFQGTPNAIFTGLVYLPNEQIGAVGNADLGGAGCLVLVVQSLAMVGNPDLNTTGCAAAGVAPPELRSVAFTE
jgi:Putative Flp pilus-assembly TadE/G-like